MAASAATLRLLLRRRASAPAPPSLTRLQPLFPGRYSTPCSPLRPAASSAGLLDVRRAQLSPAPLPYLLRHYSSKSSKESAPWRPTGRKGTPLYKEVKQHCNIVRYHLVTLLHTRRLNGLLKDLLKRSKMLDEALEMGDKEGWDDRAVAMLQNDMNNIWKALAAYEKGVDDFAEAVGSNNGLPVHILEHNQTLLKQMKDSNKCLREIVEKMSSDIETMEIMLNMTELSSPFETLKQLTITIVDHGICVVLTVMIIRAYLI